MMTEAAVRVYRGTCLDRLLVALRTAGADDAIVERVAREGVTNLERMRFFGAGAGSKAAEVTLWVTAVQILDAVLEG